MANRVRGINKQPIPANSVIGRGRGGGQGGKGAPPQVLSMTTLAQALAQTGALATSGPPSVAIPLIANPDGNPGDDLLGRKKNGARGPTGPTGATGATGATGPTGPAGSFTSQVASPWSGTAAYTAGTVATYEGAAYVCYQNIAAPAAAPAQWDPADDGNATLSTTNSTNDTAVTGNTTLHETTSLNDGQSTGKWYFEFKASNALSNNFAIGIATKSWVAGGSIVGNYAIATALGQIGTNGAGGGSGSWPGYAVGQGGCCVDLVNGNIWFVKDVTKIGVNSDGYWNSSSTANPATNTGGVAIGTSAHGNWFKTVYNGASASQKMILYSSLALFLISAVPSGFSAWAGPVGSPNPPPNTDDAHWLSQGNYSTPQGRLTLSSTLPVQIADTSAATTIYYLPYVGINLPIVGLTLPSGGVSLALDSNAGHTGYQQSGKMFDLFLYNNSGTLILATGPAWTSSTARSGAIDQTTVPGIWTNTASMTLRFGSAAGNTLTAAIGTAVCVGTMIAVANGQTEVILKPVGAAGGSAPVCGLCNIYNRVRTSARVLDTTASWTDAHVGSWQNNDTSTSNSFNYVDPLGVITPNIGFVQSVSSSNGTGTYVLIGVSFNGSTPLMTSLFNAGAAIILPITAVESFYPALGYNNIQEQEYAAGTGTITFYGFNTPLQDQGMVVDFEF